MIRDLPPRQREWLDQQLKGATMEETMANVHDYMQGQHPLARQPIQLAAAHTLDGRPYPAPPPAEPRARPSLENILRRITENLLRQWLDDKADGAMKDAVGTIRDVFNRGGGGAGGGPGRAGDPTRPTNPKIFRDPMMGPRLPLI